MLPEFRIFGPGINNSISLEELFKRRDVPKISASTKGQKVKQDNIHDEDAPPPSPFQSEHLKSMYQSAEISTVRQPALKAEQVMISPVVSLYAAQAVSEALNVLGENSFRHIPVLSENHQLMGMISDRDIYRCMCGTDSGCMHCSEDKQGILIESIMKDHVLTASVDTDARHIARLFVEQRVGAMPIVEDDRLVGIVTRSDILRAVMLHFNLDIWK